MQTRPLPRETEPAFPMKPDGSGAKVVAHTPDETGRSQSSQTPAKADRDGFDGSSRFINVLVTPKITFSLPRRADWSVADDISQEELRAAFLTRFPIQFDTGQITFTCATPARRLSDGSDYLVYRIGTEGAKEERVLLSILSEIDKAYSAKYEKQLEEARSDLISSSMSFQVVADEVRHAQHVADKKWSKEVGSLKGQLSTNQKRLFLLEQEKDNLQRTASSSESIALQLRRDLTHVKEENSEMKVRMGELEAQLDALRECLTAQISSKAAPSMASRSDAAVQANGEADDTAWQQQLMAMSEWLQTGATLLQNGPMHAQAASRSDGVATAVRVEATVHSRPAAQARARWSELHSDDGEG